MRSARRWLWPAIGLVIVAVLVATWRGGGEAAALPAGEAERGRLEVTTSTQGELAAVNSVAIAAPRGWNNKVAHLIDEGTRVSPGDTLALFDTSQQLQEVEERRTAYEAALADLENQRATGAKTLAEKEAALRRQRLALEQARLRREALRFESESRQREAELDLRRAELDVQEAEEDLAAQREINAAELAKAEAEMREERLDLQRAEERLTSLTITAPDSGMVVFRKIWAGGESRKIRQGDQVWQGQPIMELPDLDAFQVHTWVQEVDVHRLEPGQRVRVTVDALQDLQLMGEVARIAPLARTEGEDAAALKVFDVDVRLDEAPDGLLPGMTAQCEIIHEEHDGVVHVPLEAIFRRGERTVVYPADGGGGREVELGAAGEDRVIVAAGVEPGERLLLVMPGDGEGDDDPAATAVPEAPTS
ncbi:HlyD family efflux transporter periplasmic adaptor subunit [bacterium]|nr:HlyD family efflux transporter periplasmic adaptor subunit [bacterium]